MALYFGSTATVIVGGAFAYVWLPGTPKEEKEEGGREGTTNENTHTKEEKEEGGGRKGRNDKRKHTHRVNRTQEERTKAGLKAVVQSVPRSNALKTPQAIP